MEERSHGRRNGCSCEKLIPGFVFFRKPPSGQAFQVSERSNPRSDGIRKSDKQNPGSCFPELYRFHVVSIFFKFLVFQYPRESFEENVLREKRKNERTRYRYEKKNSGARDSTKKNREKNEYSREEPVCPAAYPLKE